MRRSGRLWVTAQMRMGGGEGEAAEVWAEREEVRVGEKERGQVVGYSEEELEGEDEEAGLGVWCWGVEGGGGRGRLELGGGGHGKGAARATAYGHAGRMPAITAIDTPRFETMTRGKHGRWVPLEMRACILGLNWHAGMSFDELSMKRRSHGAGANDDGQVRAGNAKDKFEVVLEHLQDDFEHSNGAYKRMNLSCSFPCRVPRSLVLLRP